MRHGGSGTTNTWESLGRLELSDLDWMYDRLAKDLKEESDAIKAANRTSG